MCPNAISFGQFPIQYLLPFLALEFSSAEVLLRLKEGGSDPIVQILPQDVSGTA